MSFSYPLGLAWLTTDTSLLLVSPSIEQWRPPNRLCVFQTILQCTLDNSIQLSLEAFYLTTPSSNSNSNSIQFNSIQTKPKQNNLTQYKLNQFNTIWSPSPLSNNPNTTAPMVSLVGLVPQVQHTQDSLPYVDIVYQMVTSWSGFATKFEDANKKVWRWRQSLYTISLLGNNPDVSPGVSSWKRSSGRPPSLSHLELLMTSWGFSGISH